MKKKLLSCLLVGAMLLAVLSGCGQTAEKSSEASKSSESKQESSASQSSEAKTESTAVEEEKGITYPLEGNIKLSIGVAVNKNVTAVCSGYAETALVKEWERLTGVDIEIIEGDINLMLASGDVPDIIMGYNANSSYPGGISAALKDKVIQPITDYVDEFAPDYKAILDSDPITSSLWVNGELATFAHYLESDYLTCSSGMIIRQDWLDDLGMKAPTNHEELYNVLKAFKEKKGAEVPLSMPASTLNNNMLGAGMMASSFGFAKSNYYVDNGVIQPCYILDEYKDAIIFFNKLYDEGLLDPNFAALDSATAMSNFLNGKSGMMFGAISSGVGAILDAKADDPNFKIAGVAPFKTPDGDIAMCTQYTDCSAPSGAFITTSCKNIEDAVKFLNFGYTEQGAIMFNFGVEGESYEMIDGVPIYTETVTNNPNMTAVQALSYYAKPLTPGPNIQLEAYMRQYNPRPEQQQCLEAWSISNAKDYTLPKIVLEGDDSTEWTNVMTDIWTYTAEMFAKFVAGIEPIDNWDKYVKQCEDFGVLRATEIYQRNYDEQYGNK